MVGKELLSVSHVQAESLILCPVQVHHPLSVFYRSSLDISMYISIRCINIRNE